MTAPRKRPGVGWIATAGALVLAVAWALVCPWLAALPRPQALLMAPLDVVAASLVGVVGWRAGPGVVMLGPRGAVRLGGVVTLSGTGASLVLGLLPLRSLGTAAAVAWALTAISASLCVALLVMLLAAWRLSRHPDESLGRSVPLRRLMAGACGLLATAAWGLASGHVLGELHADTQSHARDEARDLVALIAQRALVSNQIDAITPSALPSDGFVASLDDSGKVVSGVGVRPGATVVKVDQEWCRAKRHVYPCAIRHLVDGSIVVAAVPAVPVATEIVVGFAVTGLLVPLTALFLGALIGSGTARDLARVAQTLDALGRSTRGLDRPVVALSHDEVGDLATALGRLRARMAPGLAEYQAALDKAQAADRTRSEFLTLVSAELRNPLDRILSGARTLLEREVEPLTEEQKEDVRIVLTSTSHLVELIDEVLDLSTISTGQIALKLGEVDLGQLVSDVTKAQRPLLQHKEVKCQLDIDSPSPRARVDERRLRQVVTNVISNAVKFTEHGSIDISVRGEGEAVVIQVKDTGPGIAADALPKLFSDFVQLGSLRQRARGTGLGLAICKRLVEAHGGEVSADSQLGVGSTFRVILPVQGPDTPRRRIEPHA